SLKYWIRPNLENRVKEGSIIAHFNTVVKRIESDKIIALKDGCEIIIPTDQTFALTGYFASSKFLEQLGAQINSDDMSAVMTKAYETTVPNLFALGSAGFGTRTSDVFIENGLVHVEKAMQEIKGRF
ncbi:MAG TPA: pyridine nucleotide-disulfide oxidoreductase, partial [Trueperaceae bacterium]|nr:pyridine nucleotide-disulfide oxidoreductase [Trueperaceae bacterium]